MGLGTGEYSQGSNPELRNACPGGGTLSMGLGGVVRLYFVKNEKLWKLKKLSLVFVVCEQIKYK